MPKVTLPPLRSRRPLPQADARAPYVAIADAINAGLTWENFSPRAGIPQAMKREPYSLAIATEGVVVLPISAANDLESVEIIGWSTHGQTYAGGNVLTKKRARDGTETTIDTYAAAAHSATGGTEYRRFPVPISVAAGCKVWVDGAAAGMAVPPALWLRTKHVR